MKIFGKRKAARMERQLVIASAVTLSCVGLLILCHALRQTRGVMTDLFKKAFDTIASPWEENGDEAAVVCEEDAGDSYEI